MKTKKSTQPTANQKLQMAILKPETWLGAVILTALLVITFNSFAPRQITSIQPQATEATMTLEPVAPVAPEATFSAVSPSATPTSTPEATTAPAPTPTASPSAQPAMTVRVKPNQTFWELASRYCHDHDLAEKLAKDNGYASVTRLKTGDVVTITCTQ